MNKKLRTIIIVLVFDPYLSILTILRIYSWVSSCSHLWYQGFIPSVDEQIKKMGDPL